MVVAWGLKNQSKNAAVTLSLWSQSHHPLFIDTVLTLEPGLCLPRGTILVTVASCLTVCVCARAHACARLSGDAQVHRFQFYSCSRVCGRDVWLPRLSAAAKANTCLILQTMGISGGAHTDSQIFNRHTCR